MPRIKLLSLYFLGFSLLALPAVACDQIINLSNWKSCTAWPLAIDGGKSDWDSLPDWAQSEKVRPYFFDDPHLLAEHGLCNAKFHRVVLCLPEWRNSRDKDACWYLICSGSLASKS